jgi:hypothetical protein
MVLKFSVTQYLPGLKIIIYLATLSNLNIYLENSSEKPETYYKSTRRHIPKCFNLE